MKKIILISMMLLCAIAISFETKAQGWVGNSSSSLTTVGPTGATQPMKIGNNLNGGITTVPSANLHNNGTVLFEGLPSGTTSQVLYWDPTVGSLGITGAVTYGPAPLAGITGLSWGCSGTTGATGTLTLSTTTGSFSTGIGAWLTTGTLTGTTGATGATGPVYLGTVNQDDIRIATNNLGCNFDPLKQKMIVAVDGSVGIGEADGSSNLPTYPQNKLLVENGAILPTLYSTLSGGFGVFPNEIGILSVSNNEDATNDKDIAMLGLVINDYSTASIGAAGISIGDDGTNTGIFAHATGDEVTNGADNTGAVIDVSGVGTNTLNVGIEANVAGSSSTNIGSFIGVGDAGSGSQNTGLRISVSGTTTNDNKGINCDVTGTTGSGKNISITGSATGNGLAENIGVVGNATSTDNTTLNYGVSAFGVGGLDATGIAGYANGAASTGQNIGAIGKAINNNNTTNIGFEGQVYGTGATNIAVWGLIPNNSTSGSNNYGVWGDLSAVGSGATLNYAIYGTQKTSTYGSASAPSTGSGTSVDYAGYFVGDIFSAGSYTYSDASLKQDIREYKGAVDQLSKLNVKRYTFKTDLYPKMNMPYGEQIGLMSTNLKEVFPGLVKHSIHPANKKDEKQVDFEAVNYTALIPVLVEAVQELNGKTEAIKELADKAKVQEALITELVKQNADMNKQIAELKNLVNDICNLGCGGLQSNNPLTTGGDVVLYQSIPNPTSSSASINYLINIPFSSAVISVTGMDGKVMKEFRINEQGKGTVRFENTEMADNAYKYSLVIDGKLYGTKSIVITKN